MSEEARAKACVQAAVDAFGRLDVLASNAGVFIKLGEIDTWQAESFDYSADADGVGGVLSLQRTRDEGIILPFHNPWVYDTPSPEAVQKTRLLMDQIHLALRQHAPEWPPPSQVREEVLDVPPSP